LNGDGAVEDVCAFAHAFETEPPVGDVAGVEAVAVVFDQ
jgi:hypothetical protein